MLKSYEQFKFVPLDPVSKRTKGTVKDAQGMTFKTTKGALQVIIDMSQAEESGKAKAELAVNDFAAKGFPTLLPVEKCSPILDKGG